MYNFDNCRDISVFRKEALTNFENDKYHTLEEWKTLYPTLSSITSKYSKIGDGQGGSSNYVRTFKVKDNDDILLCKPPITNIIARLAIRPTFAIKNGVLFAKSLSTYEQANASFHIWNEVNDKNMCPRILFYGFVRERELEGGEKDTRYLTLLQIGEKYDMDLFTYYTEGNGMVTLEDREEFGVLRHMDVEIANATQKELYKIAEEVGLICLDIKTLNSVINEVESDEGISYEVKLIDWDSDERGCNAFLTAISGGDDMVIDDIFKKKLGFINMIIMANEYLKTIDWNIFSYFFTEQKNIDFMKEHKEELIYIFCKITNAQTMAIHYHFWDTIDPHVANDPINCKLIISAMIKNVTKLTGGDWNIDM